MRRIRSQMRELGVDASILTDNDPHLGEFSADRFRLRSWASGFYGSDGVLVVTADSAGLWTDSRYHLAAQAVCENGPIALFKVGLDSTPSVDQWLGEQLPAKGIVGVDSERISFKEFGTLTRALKPLGIDVIALNGFAERIYPEAPALPNKSAYLITEKDVGKSRRSKLANFRKQVVCMRVSWYLICLLDDIAWLLNIRGSDIPYQPVPYMWLLVGEKECDGAKLFIDLEKLSGGDRMELNSDSVELAPYQEIYTFLEQLPQIESVGFDAVAVPMKVANILSQRKNIFGDNKADRPIRPCRFIKNRTEIAHLQDSMVADGIAITKVLYCIEQSDYSKLTEIDIANMLTKARQAMPLFVMESFAPIIGCGEHSAIVHYHADQFSNANLRSRSLLLIDSGGHYRNGTTDITRTIALGTPNKKMLAAATAVLKAHMALARFTFPVGTLSGVLDRVARNEMRQLGYNYGHSTGHGVGFFLNVHEFPPKIGNIENESKIEPGMVFSNEPGCYFQGEWGIRIENIVVVEEESANFCRLHTISLAPIDISLVDRSLLQDEEVKWLNRYHRRVYAALSAHLSSSERAWLRRKTAPI